MSAAESDIILRTDAVTKQFGAFVALRTISAEFKRGAITSIIGPNGAGKSTYFNLLSGAFRPSSGRIVYNGRDVTGVPQHRFARLGIAKSFQITSVFPQLTTHENIRVAAQALVTCFDILRPRARLTTLNEQADHLLQTVGLWSRRHRLAGELAHGEQRALEIAMALASRPGLLLLDEPTAGMSPEETKAMMDLILDLAKERTIILVEHKMKLVLGISDRLLVLHHGELLAEGTPDDIRHNDLVKRVYLGQRATLTMLKVRDLNAWYGSSHVLQGVELDVAKGEIVCLIGRNGAGKTTILKSIMGLLTKVKGNVVFGTDELVGRPTHVRFGLGLGYVPEERRIVPGLTVRENLRLGLVASANKAREADLIARTAETFPRLAERLDQMAITMSGGEQQMLAIARAMMSDPTLVMLDEPSEGIMPVLVDEMFELFRAMKAAGTTILLVEQNVELALGIADRAYVVDQGTIAHHGTAADLLADADIQERYCAV